MKKVTLSQIITVLVTVVTITINILANALPLNGLNTGEISDRFDILFVPAGYVFSIWGVIYLGLIAFTIFQALPAQSENELLRKIYPAYWAVSIANVIWLFLWHYEIFAFTWIAMLVLLASLLYTYIQISARRPGLDRNQQLFVRLPFSIYLGWVSVASIANISQVLYYFKWSGWGITPVIWAVMMLTVAVLLGLAMLVRENDVPYTLVLVWALVGIWVSQSDTALVAGAALIGAGVLALASLAMPFFHRAALRSAAL